MSPTFRVRHDDSLEIWRRQRSDLSQAETNGTLKAACRTVSSIEHYGVEERKMARPVLRLFAVVLITLGAGCFTPLAMAYPGGISGYSGMTAGATCNSCHFGGIQPTVVLSGPTSVTTGSTNTYTLTITGGSQIAGGLDVAASGGALGVLDPISKKLMNGELTHTQPKRAAATWGAVWS